MSETFDPRCVWFVGAGPGDRELITLKMEVDLPEANQSQAVSSNDDPPVIIEVSGVGQYSVVV
ncbi:hypothetical protein MJK87_19880, partial [Salmonella enterica subsp. enterica serovar Montevideo]|nr:hypothetical protein [Salmonella enterica subsp. enterica serovar Montevideo]